MALEDEATTRETQSPGWGGTKEEFGSDGAEAGAVAETENIHQCKMLLCEWDFLAAGAITLQREMSHISCS